jgi:hypothetical protein
VRVGSRGSGWIGDYCLGGSGYVDLMDQRVLVPI